MPAYFSATFAKTPFSSLFAALKRNESPMAETEPKPQTEPVQEKEQKLKYLDFVQVAALQVVLCFASFYNYAKESSGTLKPGVQTVEDTVKTVIGPVYQKFHDVPFEILKFIDHKVDSSVAEMERHVPALVRQASCTAYSAAQMAPEVARSVASEVKRVGVIDTAAEVVKAVFTTIEPTAKDIYTKYEPVAEEYAVATWHSLNLLPLFPYVAQIAVPTTAYWAEKYNQAVYFAANISGFGHSAYLPVIPIQKIAKVFQGKEAGPPPAVPVEVAH